MFEHIVPRMLLVCATLLVAAPTQAQAQEIVAGYTPYDAGLYAVRFRSFANTGGDEIYVGVPDLGEAARRNQRQIRWAADNTIEFTYDPTGDRLLAVVDNRHGHYTLALDGAAAAYTAANGSAPPEPNLLHFSIASRDADSEVRVVDVRFEGVPFGDFAPGAGYHDFMIEGLSFKEGFTVEARIVLDGPFSHSQERSRFELRIGHRTPVCEPIIGALDPDDARLAAIDAACCVQGDNWLGWARFYYRCVLTEAVEQGLGWGTDPSTLDVLLAAWRFLQR